MTGKEFSDWMERTQISHAEAAELFGVNEQTLYNWRSTVGVPLRRLKWVRARMAEYTQQTTATLPDRISIEATPEQFDQWNRAALASGQIIRDWAADVLDAAAIIEATNGPSQRRPYRYPSSSPGPSPRLNDAGDDAP